MADRPAPAAVDIKKPCPRCGHRGKHQTGQGHSCRCGCPGYREVTFEDWTNAVLETVRDLLLKDPGFFDDELDHDAPDAPRDLCRCADFRSGHDGDGRCTQEVVYHYDGTRHPCSCRGFVLFSRAR